MNHININRGQVLVFFALALVILIGLAAFGIDIGYMYTVRHELQRCADAGALAGASRFINDPSAGETGTWNDPWVQSEATTRAIEFATKDNVIQTPLMTHPDDNVIVNFNEGYDRIGVQTVRTVPLFFSKLFLGSTKRITAYAVAEAASTDPLEDQTACLAPFGVPLPWTEVGGDPFKFESALGDHVFWPTKADGTPDKELLDAECEKSSLAEVSRWSYVTHDNVGARSPRDGYLCPGALIKLKIGDAHQTLEPGHFYGLDYSGMVTGCPPGVDINSGADFFKFMIMNRDCATGCKVAIDQSQPLPPLEIEPGNMVGPTVSAVAPDYYKTPLKFIGAPPEWNSLMNGRDDSNDPSNYTDTNYTDSFADWNYTSNTPQERVTSRRIIEVPIYDPRNPPSQGASMIQPIAFAGFWIQDIDDKQGTIIARLISIHGSGEAGSGGGSGGASSKILRLVK